ncbi:MAG: Lon protease [candidate division TM6 bacterium GW2011_GWF2_30_66]|nr:MAG: Lon protease [candidate division TM6 bacterium GW2011_GWF2_30_66]
MKSILSKDHVKSKIPATLTVVPTMDIVVFPDMIVPLLVLDPKIINGINNSVESSKLVILLASRKQTQNEYDAIGTNDLYEVGTVASIMRVIKIPEGGIKILVQGLCKAKVSQLSTEQDMLSACVEKIEDTTDEQDTELRARINNIRELTEQIATTSQTFSPDFHMILSKMSDAGKIAEFIISHLNLGIQEAQDLLETKTKIEILDKIYLLLSKEIEVSHMQEKIKSDARDSINQSQKEYYLREQLKAIKKELGEDDLEEIDDLKVKLETLPISDETKKEVKRQIARLEHTAPDSMEAAVIRNYLDWIFALPWAVETKDNLDISHAKKILDEDHHGLSEIKERILDFISIRKLKADGTNTPILCFSGPPGTGKTSLGQSIAKCLGRNYMRISLGGVKDEAEIRGHRRTYVGAMPGRFIQGLRKSGSNNPVIVIDELDKIGADFKGDPASAMLEVLDPQQNKEFYDNYLGVPFDLSKAIFIATANNINAISGPLRDRMEVINLSGYTIEEKLNIAKKHLVEKALKDSGLENYEIKLADDVLLDIITSYTREAGVRQLDRIIRKLFSKEARSLAENNKTIKFTSKNIETYLGPRIFLDDDISKEDIVGVTNGLAWTMYGGEIIKVEAMLIPGKGKLILTGHLGNVMKESAQAALSYARAHASEFGIKNEAFDRNDLHIHVPAGAIPKDGPSAGVTMLTSILSAYTQKPINAKYAMTGEINLHGDVMPIGGVKEKVLAAKYNKLQYVILPEKNRSDLQEDKKISDGINVIFVKRAEEIMKMVLMSAKKAIIS